MLDKSALLLLFGLFLTSLMAAQHAAIASRSPLDIGEQETIRQIVDLERQTKEASLHRDADFCQRTLADDYVGVTPLGQIATKQDVLRARKSGQLRYDTMDITEMVVRVYGDTAIVTARADVKGRQLGEDFSGPYRFTRVWIRRAGHWETVSYQATVTQ